MHFTVRSNEDDPFKVTILCNYAAICLIQAFFSSSISKMNFNYTQRNTILLSITDAFSSTNNGTMMLRSIF